jgi:hypothetical protein
MARAAAERQTWAALKLVGLATRPPEGLSCRRDSRKARRREETAASEQNRNPIISAAAAREQILRIRTLAGIYKI